MNGGTEGTPPSNVYACIFKDDAPRRLGNFAVLNGVDLAYLMMNPRHKRWDYDLLRTVYDIRLTVCTRVANEVACVVLYIV